MLKRQSANALFRPLPKLVYTATLKTKAQRPKAQSPKRSDPKPKAKSAAAQSPS